jgi:hypothetical protein
MAISWSNNFYLFTKVKENIATYIHLNTIYVFIKYIAILSHVASHSNIFLYDFSLSYGFFNL